MKTKATLIGSVVEDILGADWSRAGRVGVLAWARLSAIGAVSGALERCN